MHRGLCVHSSKHLACGLTFQEIIIWIYIGKRLRTQTVNEHSQPQQLQENDCHLQMHVEPENPQEILSVKDQKSPKWTQMHAHISVYPSFDVCTCTTRHLMKTFQPVTTHDKTLTKSIGENQNNECERYTIQFKDLFMNWTNYRELSLLLSCPLLYSDRPIFSGGIVGSIQKPTAAEKTLLTCSLVGCLYG